MGSDPFDFGRPRRYAVMGCPVHHSLSPRIHAEFARSCQIALTYDAIEVSPGGFAQAVSHFQALGGAGLNVTVPFKLEAAALAERLSPAAALAGSVNTLILGEELCGDNTDGVGLMRDLTENLGIDPGGRRVLILGAGGAVRGILAPLAAAGVAGITIANRDVPKARALIAALAPGLAAEVVATPFADLAGHRFDIVVNATSAGLAGARVELPPGVVAEGTFAYDLVYGDAALPFVDWARSAGARATDGLGMLVEQAAESFRIWHGVRPQTRALIAALRQGAGDHAPDRTH